jgi:hypothetical protein
MPFPVSIDGDPDTQKGGPMDRPEAGTEPQLIEAQNPSPRPTLPVSTAAGRPPGPCPSCRTARRRGVDTDFTQKSPQPFDPGYMRALFDYGYQQGRNGYHWAHKPPFFL